MCIYRKREREIYTHALHTHTHIYTFSKVDCNVPSVSFHPPPPPPSHPEKCESKVSVMAHEAVFSLTGECGRKRMNGELLCKSEKPLAASERTTRMCHSAGNGNVSRSHKFRDAPKRNRAHGGCPAV